MANWMRDATASFDPKSEPTSAVMVYIDKSDPDCGLGFVRYVLKEDRERIIALLEAELSLLKKRHKENADGDDVVTRRVMEESRRWLESRSVR